MKERPHRPITKAARLPKPAIYGPRNRKLAQTLLEFALLIVVVAAALIAMRTYIGRSIQGKLRESLDSMGGQYDPMATVTEIHNMSSNTETRMDAVAPSGGGVGYETLRTDATNTIENRTRHVIIEDNLK